MTDKKLVQIKDLAQKYDISIRSVGIYANQIPELFPEIRLNVLRKTIDNAFAGKSDSVVDPEVVHKFEEQFEESKNLIDLRTLAAENDVDEIELQRFTLSLIKKNVILNTKNIFNEPGMFYFQKTDSKSTKTAANILIWKFLKMKIRENKEFSKKIKTNAGFEEFHILEEVADEKGLKKGRIIGFTKSRGGGYDRPVVCRYSGEMLIENSVKKLHHTKFIYKHKNRNENQNGPIVLFEFPLEDLLSKKKSSMINVIIDSFSDSEFTFKNEGDVFYFYVESKHLIHLPSESHENISNIAFYLNKVIDESAELLVSSNDSIVVQSTLMPFTVFFKKDEYNILKRELDFYREMYDPNLDDSSIVQSILRLFAKQRNVDFERLLARISIELDLINEEERNALVNEQRHKKQEDIQSTMSNIYPGYFA